MSDGMTAEEVVTMLNKMFTLFDERAQKEGIEKIKTIGDAYMAVAGLTLESQNNGAEKMIRFAQGLLKDVYAFNEISPIKPQIRQLRPSNTAKILKLM
jgi:class 3 adenylate cyclase